MIKTGAEIEQHIYQLLQRSGLKNLISGKIYLAGLRPLNSKKEDTVVIFQTALTGQIQNGSVNVNTYIPDIAFTNEGSTTKIKDFARCNLIERACQDFVDSLKADKYRIGLNTAIQTFAHEPEQHFVNMRLKFNYVTF